MLFRTFINPNQLEIPSII